MTQLFRMETATPADAEKICRGLREYNQKMVPFTQHPPFIPVHRIIRDPAGGLAAGILAEVYCWDCMTVDVLWVREDCRGSGLGSRLLAEAEQLGREHGCHLAHLDTFDFQAKGFYERQGYSVFGVLEDCPRGHNRYFLRKYLQTEL